MGVFGILTPKTGLKRPFYGQKPEILFPGQESAFFICSARKAGQGENLVRHIEN